MADGHIICHGPTTTVLEYFLNLGYHCPEYTDVGDFLQDIPTPDDRRFTIGHSTVNGDHPPIGTIAQAGQCMEGIQRVSDNVVTRYPGC